MPGDYEQKFASLRAFYAYMMAHPGKKLLFMGQEFAQFIEWDFAKQLDWLLLQYEKHKQMQGFVRTLNKHYLENRALWEIDDSWQGFSWIANDDNEQSVIAFTRQDKDGNQTVAVCNFVPVERVEYRIGVPQAGTYKIVLNTDDSAFGGNDTVTEKSFRSQKEPMHGFDNSIVLHLPPLSVMYLQKRTVHRSKKTEAKPKVKK